jgi:hypothetical protein
LLPNVFNGEETHSLDCVTLVKPISNYYDQMKPPHLA